MKAIESVSKKTDDTTTSTERCGPRLCGARHMLMFRTWPDSNSPHTISFELYYISDIAFNTFQASETLKAMFFQIKRLIH